MRSFNSHTARGSSTLQVGHLAGTHQVSIPILRVGVQQDEVENLLCLIDVSIPILRVGVQQLVNGNCKYKQIVSIPILRVGVQP